MFSASVWGEVWGPEVSFLDVSGGSKRSADGESDFLIWEMLRELTKLDRITFYFEEGTTSAPTGTKFDTEAYPPEEPKIEISYPPPEEDITRLEARPHLNSGLLWSFSVNGGQSIDVAPDVVQQHVRLHLLWNEDRPERLRVSLTKTSLRETVSRSEGKELFSGHVSLGSNIAIEVGA